MTHPRRREPPRLPDNPEEGYYLARLVPGGPRVPCMITTHNQRWMATICGMWAAGDYNPYKAAYVLQICNYGTKITEADYEAAMADPATSRLDPFQAVDVGSMPVEEEW